MEDHKHCHESVCKNLWSGHNFVWARILLGILIISFVFCIGVMIGRIGGLEGRYYRGGYERGYKMMGGASPMMYYYQAGVQKAAAPTSSTTTK